MKSLHSTLVTQYIRPLLVSGVIGISITMASLNGPGVFAADVTANATSDLTTSPISVDVAGAPGTTVSTTLEVQDNAPQAVNLGVRLEEFKAEGTTGQAQIFPPIPNDPTVSWVHFSRTSFVAQPAVWNSVVMTINLPKTAAFGYYYAVLFSPISVIGNLNTNADIIHSSNAILVLVDAHAPGQINKVSVASFTTARSTYQFLPISFNVEVHNDGNVFTVPEGDVYISRSKNGQPIDTIDLNSGQGNVLPGTDRVFTVSWGNGFPIYQFRRVDGQIVSGKSGKPVQQLAWNVIKLPDLRFGKYYAHLALAYNNGARDVSIDGYLSFWVLPWTLIYFVLLGIVSIIILWETIRRLYNRFRDKAWRR